jgi:hypothetical protein
MKIDVKRANRAVDKKNLRTMGRIVEQDEALATSNPKANEEIDASTSKRLSHCDGKRDGSAEDRPGSTLFPLDFSSDFLHPRDTITHVEPQGSNRRIISQATPCRKV